MQLAENVIDVGPSTNNPEPLLRFWQQDVVIRFDHVLGFAQQPRAGGPAFRLGDSLVLLEKDHAATVDPIRQARGWRYITLQVADIRCGA